MGLKNKRERKLITVKIYGEETIKEIKEKKKKRKED